MGKTLYDVLELSRTASTDAIDAAHQRLTAKYSPDIPENATSPDAQNLLKAVVEAHRILSDSQKRARYDIFLDTRDEVPPEAEAVSFWTPVKLSLFAILLIAFGLGYYNFHLKELEKTRQIAAMEREKQEAETEAERLRTEQEKIHEARQDQVVQLGQDMVQRAQSEQARREGQQIIQEEIAAEQAARMESQRLAQQAAMAADRQSMIERQKFEAQRRQEEYQRQADQARQDRIAAQQSHYLNGNTNNQHIDTLNDLKIRSMRAN